MRYFHVEDLKEDLSGKLSAFCMFLAWTFGMVE